MTDEELVEIAADIEFDEEFARRMAKPRQPVKFGHELKQRRALYDEVCRLRRLRTELARAKQQRAKR